MILCECVSQTFQSILIDTIDRAELDFVYFQVVYEVLDATAYSRPPFLKEAANHTDISSCVSLYKPFRIRIWQFTNHLPAFHDICTSPYSALNVCNVSS